MKINHNTREKNLAWTWRELVDEVFEHNDYLCELVEGVGNYLDSKVKEYSDDHLKQSALMAVISRNISASISANAAICSFMAYKDSLQELEDEQEQTTEMLLSKTILAALMFNAKFMGEDALEYFGQSLTEIGFPEEMLSDMMGKVRSSQQDPMGTDDEFVELSRAGGLHE